MSDVNILFRVICNLIFLFVKLLDRPTPFARIYFSISLGPVFKTASKDVNFDPQGLETVRQWRSLMPPDVPLVAIGGIGDAYTAKRVREAGADCAAIIGAVTTAEDVTNAVEALNEAMNGTNKS